MLRQLSQAYQENPDQMEPNIRQIAQRLDEAWYQNRAGTFDMSKLERIAVATAQNCDIFYGGVTGAPKFPNVPIIELMWRAYLRTGMQQFLSLVLCTLDYMGRGGIYDQIGGGFARYTIDEEWQIPHFEKMLYDNAQMLDLMTLVWQHGRQPVLKTAHRRNSRLGVARHAGRECGLCIEPRCRHRRRRGQVLRLDGKRNRQRA